jgi:hypothetical protein
MSRDLALLLKGEQSLDNNVLTSITALNMVIRMEPNLYVLLYPVGLC